MARKKKKTILSMVAVVLIFLVLLGLATRLLQPKYMTDLVEGSMLSQYYRESGGHDVIFVGDCEMYANISPMELYRDQGITAYVRGSSQQLIWQSYYVLKETFKYETPRAVVFNVNAMRYGEPISEAFHRLTIDKMKWSKEKVDMIQASMMEEEDFWSYVFPILRYHSRFDELTKEDFQYFFKTKDTTWNGHLMNKNIKPLESLPAQRILADYSFPEICWDYLEQMRQLCQEYGAELILVKAPSVYPFWYDEYDAQIQEYADKHGLAFYNFLDNVEEMGIDYNVDTYDGGLHLNLAGAQKLSSYFAKILAENHGMADHRKDSAIAAEYEEKLRLYDEEAAK